MVTSSLLPSMMKRNLQIGADDIKNKNKEKLKNDFDEDKKKRKSAFE